MLKKQENHMLWLGYALINFQSSQQFLVTVCGANGHQEGSMEMHPLCRERRTWFSIDLI